MHVSFDANNAEELKAKIKDFVIAFMPALLTLNTAPEPSEASTPTEESPAEKKSRKAKETKKETPSETQTASAPVPAPETKQAVPGKTYTKDDAVDALKKVTATFEGDISYAKKLLEGHGVKKLGELKPEVYPAFIEQCLKLVESRAPQVSDDDLLN